MIPEVSVVVVNYRQAALASRCVESVRREFESGGVAGEILLIDCGSGPGEAAALEAIPARIVRLPDNRGYSGGLNAGLALALADRIV
ncbi:MAG TPA: glycosyltransferase, partial [Thermoanaerobaculia bacterium]